MIQSDPAGWVCDDHGRERAPPIRLLPVERKIPFQISLQAIPKLYNQSLNQRVSFFQWRVGPREARRLA